MSDLIDRQAAIDAECKVCAVMPEKSRGIKCEYYPDGCCEVMCLFELPAIQTQKIIRCKDCRYTDEYGVCQSSKGLAIQDDDDFCSHAERKDL